MPCSMCTFHLGGEDDGKPSTSGLQPNVKLHTCIKLREHQLMHAMYLFMVSTVLAENLC